MSSKTKNILIVVLLVAVPIGIILSCRADTVGNHAAAIEHANIVRFSGVKGTGIKGNKVWSGLMVKLVYQKAPSGEEDDFDSFHREALVRLKYLERRELVHPDLTAANFGDGTTLSKQVYATFLEVLRSDPITEKLGTFRYDTKLPGFVAVAAPAAMPKFEKALKDLIESRAIENP